jgi:hypothetical protein
MFEPETQKLPPPFLAGFHPHVKPTLEVSFPTRVIRVSITLDLDMTDDRDRCSTKEPDDTWFPMFVSGSVAEDPAVAVEAGCFRLRLN